MAILWRLHHPIVVYNLVAVAILWRLHHKLCYACCGVIWLCMRRALRIPAGIGAESFLAAMLWLVSEVCYMSTSPWVVFKWFHFPLTTRQLAVIHHTTG